MKRKSTIIRDRATYATRYGIIDLGTNTFSLIIVGYNEELGSEIEHREGRFVKLAEGGINHIGPEAFQRAVNNMKAFAEILKQYDVKRVEAFGTAALRRAENSADLVAAIQEETGIEVKVISGSEEAALIYKGVSQAVSFDERYKLIMDIGGGSVEFIIANQEGVRWAKSFPVGVAILRNRFHKSEPIAPSEISTLKNWLDTTLRPLYEALSKQPIEQLVGASGTFDVLAIKLPKVYESDLHTAVSAADFYPLLEEVVAANYTEREKLRDIPSYRADMLVVAMLLIETILEKIQVQHIVASPYAMKEGIMRRIVEI
ncbi:MAG: exopolyphosphatase [Bacteroidota bacterium]